MKDIRVALAVCNAPVGCTQNNLDRMLQWIREAKNQAADLICFPEMNMTGYGNDPVIRDCAEPIPNALVRNLLQVAKNENIVILAGLAERDPTGRIYASHLVLKPNGDIGVYRKLHLAPPERAAFTAGSKIPLFEAAGARFGIQLCYDAHFPELSGHMASKGADLIFLPHASPRGTPQQKFSSWMRHLPARAFDNSVFIAACNQTGDNQNGLTFPGIAVVLGPSGEILGKDTSGRQGILVADLRADMLARVRNHHMRYFLPNRRPELYQ